VKIIEIDQQLLDADGNCPRLFTAALVFSMPGLHAIAIGQRGGAGSDGRRPSKIKQTRIGHAMLPILKR
jgi:hypothetical protein